MYVPHGPESNCVELYHRIAQLHPDDGLLEDDFTVGCEAAKRERIALGVGHDLDP